MSSTQILIAIIVLQQGFFSLMWAGAAWLSLARPAAVHWALATVALAAAMILIIERPDLPIWSGRWLPNAINILSFAIVRRGVQVFMRQAPTDIEHGLVVLAGALGTAWAIQADSAAWFVLAANGAMAWSLLRCGAEAARGLHEEFGPAGAWACSAPMWLVGSLMALRSAAPLAGATPIAQPLDTPGDFNTGLLFAFIAMGLLINASMGGMVVVRLIARLRKLSLHDPLTQLLNRRGMELALATEYRRARRQGHGFALLVLDVDHFKLINDRHGHAVGDRALAGIAATLRSASRAVDSVGRVGGEEFSLLLPDTGQEGALRAAERLLDQVRSADYGTPAMPLRLTVSIGVAVADDANERFATLWQRADTAMYAAKQAGRDRLALAPKRGTTSLASAA